MSEFHGVTAPDLQPIFAKPSCWLFEETDHKPGACAGVVAAKFWTFLVGVLLSVMPGVRVVREATAGASSSMTIIGG